MKTMQKVRPYNPWLWFAIPVWCLLFLVYFPPHQLDVAISQLFYINNGWPWHGNAFFSEVLHKGTKAVPIVIAIGVVFQIGKQFWQKRHQALYSEEKVKRLGYVFLSMLFCVVFVWWLKETTAVSCPWSTVPFGGSRAITDPSLSWVFRAGNCWPAGHAGTGFCLFAFYFYYRDHRPSLARWVLTAVFVFGFICATARMMQGAHFASHGMATMLIDWLISAALYVLMFDRKAIVSRFVNTPFCSGTTSLLLVTALFWTVFLDIPFWRSMIVSAGSDTSFVAERLVLIATLFASFFFVAMAVIELLSILPRQLFAVLLSLLSISGIISLVAALLYGTTMTPDMIRNFLETDPREAGMYFSVTLVVLSLFLLLPVVAVWKSAFNTRIAWIDKVKRIGIFSGCLIVGVLLIFTQFQPFSAAMRNDKSARYLIAPFNVIYSTTSTLLRDKSTDGHRVRTIIDSKPTMTVVPKKPTVMVVAIGETARSVSWQLAGYERETTPTLSAMRDIISIPKVMACGTSTDVSLPCMLSRIGRRDYDWDRILTEESLPALLQRAGVKVLWVDNQSGSKGTSDGVPTVHPSFEDQYCHDGECLDAVFIKELQTQINQAKAGETTVLFFHMMGSHGPAYDRRSEKQDKIFGPVCQDSSFRGCRPEEIRNAYDSSIHYTDRVLSGLIKTLQKTASVNSAFIYVSDHGESIGENGLYLHGAPFYMAPDEQKIVPMVMWTSSGFDRTFNLDKVALRDAASDVVTHDHLYHTILGMLKIQSSTYDVQWDLTATH